MVNYRPGFGYASVRRLQKLESLRYVGVTSAYDMQALIGQFESNVVALRQHVKVEDQVKAATRVLVDFTFLLHAICRGLHAEILERTGIDQRWRNDRKRFAQDRGLVLSGVEWPC